MSTELAVRDTRRAAIARCWLPAAMLVMWLGLPSGRALAEDDYDTTLAEAVAEFQRQNWIEARALFKRAHELKPNARTLRGSAIAAFEAKLYVDAYLELGQALASKVKPLTPAQRTDAQRILERTKLFISRVRVAVEPRQAELTIDGKPGVIEDGAMLLDPGVHELVARAAGRETITQRLDLEPGDQRDIQIELPVQQDDAAAPASTHETAPAAATQPSGPPQGATRYGLWPWVAAGAAVAFAGAGVGLHVAASSAADDVEKACPAGACTLEEINARIDDGNIQTFDTLKVVAWGLAGAAAATSVVLFVLDGTQGTEGAPAAALRVGPGGVALSGRF
jgi:hypothetical protein